MPPRPSSSPHGPRSSLLGTGLGTRIALAAALATTLAASALLPGCRPDNSAYPVGGDAGRSPPDLFRPPDLAGNPGPRPPRANVAPTGGEVDRLFFGFTGDTRPSEPDDTERYPIATVTGIFDRMESAGVQFAVDLGDHMYVVSRIADAPVQMGFYRAAAAHLARPLFMTLGNHDCNQLNCFYAPGDPNFAAYMEALRPVAEKPFYRVDVKTRAGLAVLVVVSDNYFDAAQFEWLEKTLAEADRTARYTIVARHHPLGYDSIATLTTQQIILGHKYSLLLTGHAHTYVHDRNDPSGRTVIYGLGGVPSSGPAWGYGIVQQGLDDRLYVTIHDQATGLPLDGWSVAPQ